MSQFSLEWLGGPAEHRLRRSRPGFDDLPWGSFDRAALGPEDDELLEARAVWTNGVFTEYASAAAFSAMSQAFLECRAPVDLCAAAADFAVDELVHVALVSRLVMTLGGSAPFVADLSRVAPLVLPLPPLLRAAELAVKVSCVGEALSLPALADSRRGAIEPLTRAVLDRLRRDEGPHAAIGHWFLEWAEPSLTDADRDYLGRVATDAVAVYVPLWRDDPTRRELMDRAVDERIVSRLAPLGIRVSSTPCRPTTGAPATRRGLSMPT